MEPTASQIIDALDGTAATARLCEVEPAAVSQWRINGIPHGRLMFLRLAKPEIFESLTNSTPTSSDSTNGSDVREAQGPVGRMPPDAAREMT